MERGAGTVAGAKSQRFHVRRAFDDSISPSQNAPRAVHLRGCLRGQIIGLLIFGRNDGLQTLTFPPLLTPVAVGRIVCCVGYLFCFCDRRFFYIAAIHHIIDDSY